MKTGATGAITMNDSIERRIRHGAAGIHHERANALFKPGKSRHALPPVNLGGAGVVSHQADLDDAAVREVIPRWHYAMLNDIDRNRAFAAAIAALPLSGATVLEIGTGSGFLSILAARAGAAKVYACEAFRHVAATASDVVALHELEDTISVVPKLSFDLKVGIDLPSRADVLITETVDCGLVGEGLLPIVRHAKNELLTARARIIPMRASLHAALLESSDVHALNYVTEAEGVDVTLFNRFSTKSYFPVRLDTWRHRLLGAGVEVFAFDFRNDDLEDRETTLFLPAASGGVVHGVVFWFSLELCPGVRVTNRPGMKRGHWMQAVQCFEKPINVCNRPGLQIKIQLSGSSILTELVH